MCAILINTKKSEYTFYLLGMFPFYNVLRSLIGIYLLYPEWENPWKGLNKLVLEFWVYFRMQWKEISKGK